MAALLSVLSLVCSLVITTCVLLWAAIYQSKKSWNAFSALTLFTAYTFLMSLFTPSLKQMIDTQNYLAVFLLGAIEEHVKAFCILFYFGHYITKSWLLKNSLTNSPIWLLAIYIATLENWQLLIEPIVTSFIYVSQSREDALENLLFPAVTFYSVPGIFLLSLSSLLRITLHFALLWSFIYFWLNRQRLISVSVATLHGVINVMLVQMNAISSTPFEYIMRLVITFALNAGLLLILITLVRKKKFTNR